MSNKKNIASLTSDVQDAAEEISAKVRLFRMGPHAAELVLDTSIPSNWTKQKLGKEILPPLKRALDEAKADEQGIDLIVVRHDDRAGLVEVKAPAGRGRRTLKNVTPRSARTTMAKSAELGYSLRRGIGKTSQSVDVDIVPAPARRPSTAELADQMTPDAPVPSPAQALLAQRESQARWALLEEFGAWTSEQIADNRSSAKNRHALANRWRAEGRVFSVELHGQRLFPGFQFDPETYAPEPIVAEVLAALPCEEMSEWELALWWTTANDWLDWGRPVEAIDEDPEALIVAAAHLAEPSLL